MDERPGQSMAWPVQAADTVCVFPGRNSAGAAGQPPPARPAGLGVASPRPRSGSAGGFGLAAQPGHRRGADHGECSASPAQRPTERRCRLLGQGRADQHRRPGAEGGGQDHGRYAASMALGVTAWRSVVVAMVQRMGPAPNRKKASAASARRGERTPGSATSGRWPAARTTAGDDQAQASRRARRGASSAPASMRAIDAQRQAHAGGVQLRSRMA